MERAWRSLSFPSRRCPSWSPDCLLSFPLPDRIHRWPCLPRKYRLWWYVGHIPQGSGAKSPRNSCHGLHPSRLQPQPEAQRPGWRHQGGRTGLPHLPRVRPWHPSVTTLLHSQGTEGCSWQAAEGGRPNLQYPGDGQVAKIREPANLWPVHQIQRLGHPVRAASCKLSKLLWWWNTSVP